MTLPTPRELAWDAAGRQVDAWLKRFRSEREARLGHPEWAAAYYPAKGCRCQPCQERRAIGCTDYLPTPALH